MIKHINKLFTCQIGWKNRLLRVSGGIVVNLLTLTFMDHIPTILFWSLVITSYFVILEALIGCSMLHWMYKITKGKDADKL